MTQISKLNTDLNGLKNQWEISVAKHPFYQRAIDAIDANINNTSMKFVN